MRPSGTVTVATLDERPGFRRRLRVDPGPGWVVAALEDDFHRMSVVVEHDGIRATAIEPEMERKPWTSCPGARQVLRDTFIGVALDRFAAGGAIKFSNCTHLYDLATIAATHAHDAAPLVYDILVADRDANHVNEAELRRDGEVVLAWSHRDGTLLSPPELAGMTLATLKPWVKSLPRAEQEVARLLQWGSMMARGRDLSIEEQSAAILVTGRCYTFQPENRARAVRLDNLRDFSTGTAEPLER